jgi:tubulin monoglycylase TTLL3/8
VLNDGGLNADGVATETALRVALRVCKHQAEYEESLVQTHASDDVPARTPLDETERAALRECPAFRPKRANVSFETNDKGKQNQNRSSSAPLSPALREACVAALAVLDRANPQASMEGDCGVWILKPAGKSRGRGIGCVTSLEQARRHVLSGSRGPFEQRRRAWVAQKYIERPLLIRGRKFDVRVWVFVTGVAPLRVWMWREPYLRFCAEEYALDDVSNVFRHLSNNAVAAHSPAHAAQAMGEGNMWRLENFKAFLRSTRAERARGRAEARGGREGGGGGLESSEIDLKHVSEDDHDPFVDEWETSLEPQMRAAAVATLACAEDGLESGGATSACQLFGYDFVIDEHMKVWLLEVNSSPCMEHSTPVTADLCPRAFDDAFEVLEDDRGRGEEAALPLGARRGGWELVHVGAPGDDRTTAASGAAKWGVDLTVKGDASVYQREAQRFRKQAQTADAERANNKPGCAVIQTGFDGGDDAGHAGGLPRAPAWEPAWERLSKAHTRSSMAGRTVRVK